MTETPSETGTPSAEAKRALELIARALSGLRFGELTVIVQDGVVVQLERTERTRLRRGRS